MVNRMNRYTPCNSNNGTCGRAEGPNNCTMGGANAQLMARLRKVDFALVDTILYLDAYPHCKNAMEHYKKLVAERKMLIEKLEKSGMPINAVGNLSDSWNWIDSPWPWEYEANV